VQKGKTCEDLIWGFWHSLPVTIRSFWRHWRRHRTGPRRSSMIRKMRFTPMRHCNRAFSATQYSIGSTRS